MNKLLRSILLAASLVLALVPSASAKELIYLISVSWTSGPLMGVKSRGYVSFDDSLAVSNAQYTAPNLLSRLAFKVGNVRYGLSNVTSGFLSFDSARQLRLLSFGTSCGPGYCGSSDNVNSLYFVYDSQSQLDRFFAVYGPAVEGKQSYGSGTLQLITPTPAHDPFDTER